MSKKLIQQFQRLEEQTDTFFNILEKFSDKQLRYRPDGKAWSMLDIVEHLVVSETGVNKFFKKYPPNNSKFKMTLKHHIQSWLMQINLILPTRFKAPSILLPPKGKTSLAEWRNIWSLERSKLKQTIKTLDKNRENASVFKHPVSGPMDMYHVINFQRNHIKHHIHQVNRIQKHNGFPK